MPLHNTVNPFGPVPKDRSAGMAIMRDGKDRAARRSFNLGSRGARCHGLEALAAGRICRMHAGGRRATATAEIQRIFDSGRAQRVCLPGPGCHPNTVLPVTRGTSNEFVIEGPWVDWARVSVTTLSGSGSVSLQILEQTAPSVGQGRMRLRVTPVSGSTGERRIRLLRRTNELNPMVPADIGSFRVQMVRNGRLTGISNARVTAGASNVPHVISGTDIGNAELIAPGIASVQINGNTDTSYTVRSSYAGGRTTNGRAVYCPRERIGPFNGFWYNEYFPAQTVTVLPDQTTVPTAPGQAPTPIAPSGAYNTHRCAEPAPPPFSWSAVSGATNYEIRYTNLTSGRTHLQRTAVGVTSQKPPFLFLNGNQYQWQVRALNGAGAGPWSAALGFTGQDGPASRNCYIAGTARVSYF